METQNLQQVIDGVGLYDPDSPTAAAQKELNELQRLAEVVKGFIEEHYIETEEDVDNMVYDGHRAIYGFLHSICDIVGYYKE